MCPHYRQTLINEKYISSEENTILGDAHIIMGALELMSYYMIDMLNIALDYFNNNRNELDEKIKFIILLNEYILKMEKYECFDIEFINEVKAICRGCCKTSVLQQQPLKNACFVRLCLRNCKSLCKSNRLLQQAL